MLLPARKSSIRTFSLSIVSSSCFLAWNSYASVDCSALEQWQAQAIYNTGDQVQHDHNAYQANYWTQGHDPVSHSGEWGQWQFVEHCIVEGEANIAPTVSLISPSGTDVITAGSNVILSAEASDQDGSIERVDFLVNGQIIGSSTAPPYQVNWQAIEGNHTISALAYDDEQSMSNESSVVIFIDDQNANDNAAPIVAITLSTTVVDLGDSVTLTVEASDDDGSVSAVDIYANDLLVTTLTSAPYQFDYLAESSGDITFHAIAHDNLDASATSQRVVLTVNATSMVTNCRPDGLYQTPGVTVPYCSIYDQDGREMMGADHPRRVIGYFTSWRSGDDPQSSYLVNDIPWQQLTHINYAFVSIGSDGKVNIGDVNDPNNVAVGREWPDVEIDPSLGFKGHFGALATYKQQYGVKTLVSIGGWAETGGHFDDTGVRIDDGGFYTMTTNDDGSINHQGIETFADSAVSLIRQYKFDGIDIDYEYPTSMAGSGNPLDSQVMEPRRAYLWASYQELMKVLRNKLDQASAQDGVHYLLTIAAPSSGYLLRGMETFDVTQYLDYVNIMSYDLHGAWNDHVGHNAALYDTGLDSELAQWNVYSTAAYGGLGYLNTDWAYHYFRGSMPAGRINIGVPYYTRGWQDVVGGDNGLWGRAALPDQTQCPDGTGVGESNNCGYGAIGIDNMWHDTDLRGNEMGAGSNPIWHAKNLQHGVWGSYSQAYQLDPENESNDQLVGNYTRYYDDVAVAPWLWNEQKRVFLSMEDKASIEVKADYVIDKEIGGIMFWELAGDYNCYLVDENGMRTSSIDASEQACAAGQGEFHIGNTMTKAIYEKFSAATPYGNSVSTHTMPSETLDIRVSIDGFKIGDQNYPINPKITFTNQTGVALPGGTEFQFDVPVSAPDNVKDQSGANLSVVSSGHTRADNIGGLDGVMHRVSFTLPAWQSLENGETFELDMVYYLPISGPANYTVSIDGSEYGFAFEHPQRPKADLSANSNNDEDQTGEVVTWKAGETQVSNGDIVIYDGSCFTAQNSPGVWDTPTTSSWFWNSVNCP